VESNFSLFMTFNCSSNVKDELPKLSLTLIESIDSLLITAIVERRFKNIGEFVGFNNLQTVLPCLGRTIALANAKC